MVFITFIVDILFRLAKVIRFGFRHVVQLKVYIFFSRLLVRSYVCCEHRTMMELLLNVNLNFRSSLLLAPKFFFGIILFFIIIMIVS